MAQAVILRDGLVLADRQDTCRSEHLTVAYDKRAVVQRRILEEDILYQPRRDLCIQPLSGIHYLLEVSRSGQDDERPCFGRSHMPASLGDLQDLLACAGVLLGRFRPEDFERREP